MEIVSIYRLTKEEADETQAQDDPNSSFSVNHMAHENMNHAPSGAQEPQTTNEEYC